MRKSLKMLYDITRNGEKTSGRKFAKEKEKLFKKTSGELNEKEYGEVIKSAEYSLKIIKKAGLFECDNTGGVYIYETVLNYIAGCAGNISEKGLADYFGSAEFFRHEMMYLPDFIKIAALQRLAETEKDSAEHLSLLSSGRKAELIDFKKLFFAFCIQSKILDGDETYRHSSDKTKEIYLNCLEKYAKRNGFSEKNAAMKALSEAKKQGVDVGEILLRQRKKSSKTYYMSLVAFTVLLSGSYVLLLGKPTLFMFLVLPVCITIYDVAKQILAGIFTRKCSQELVRLKDGERLDNAKCVITVPVILTGEEHDGKIFDRLEDFYLRNKSKNFIFSVLGDLGESATKEKDGDREIISYARARINSLNEKYGGGFAVFIRERFYCDCQQMYLSRERKRGGVEELCKFIAGEEIMFKTLICDRAALKGCNYLLTLDADTDLPYGAVKELLSVMLHPHNKPVIDCEKRIIVKGHGIIQPLVICSLSSAEKTAFASITSGGGGIDIYSGTSRELYQSISGVGNFCGKGMIDIDAYLAVCADRFPAQRILSHDLPEGVLLRCGYADDIVMSDTTPKNAISYFERLKRWMRGDLQSLIFLSSVLEDSVGEKRENHFPSWGKYRIIDNILRHLLPLSALAAVFAASFAGVRIFVFTLMFSFAFLFYAPALRIASSIISGDLFSRGKTLSELVSIKDAALYFAFRFASLGEESGDFFASVIKTAWRFAVSKKHFLDWISAAQSDRNKGGLWSYYLRLIPSVLAGVFAFVAPHPILKAFAALWTAFPLVMWILSAEKKYSSRLGKRGKKIVLENAKRSWGFFDEYVTEKTNFLPPDNCQISPVEVVTMRTSPTNIGMYLVSILAARDLGIITSEKMYEKLSSTASTLEKMIRWHGHFYNWYDIKTLEVIGGAFVSSVDSGNFAVSVVALCEGIKEYVSECTALLDVLKRYENILKPMDFSALYDERSRLFYVGYNANGGKFTDSKYDIFMSESRLLSYYAVCSGQVPASHYYSPARKLCGKKGKVGVFSWSGTAFEFFMPSLFLPVVRKSLTDRALSFAVHEQRENGVVKIVSGRRMSIFGISESQYFRFDPKMNYQYSAFGIGALALDPEASCEKVFSPYSLFLMLPYLPSGIVAALRSAKKAGVFGKYGFYEAIDFSQKRVGQGYAVIKSYMSHHLGMAMISAVNACFEEIFVSRFMRNVQMRAGKILLEERISKNAEITSPKTRTKTDKKPAFYGDFSIEEIKYEHNVLSPDVYMLSNNKTRFIASSSGHMSMYDGNICVFTSNFDKLSLKGGLMVTAEVDGKLIAPFPLGYTDSIFDSKFTVEKNENTLIYRSRHQKQGKTVDFNLSIRIRADYSIADISADIYGNVKNARIMLYYEPVMQEERAYYSHKSFSGLFLQSETIEDKRTVIVKRRPRSESGETFCALKATGTGDFEFETGRDKLLPGYGAREIAELISLPCDCKNISPMIPAVRAVSGRCRHAIFSIGFSSNKDDLLYYIEKGDGTDGKAISALQHGAAGLGKNADAFESFLLRSIFFPRNDADSTDQTTLDRIKRRPFDRSALYKHSISGDNPMIAVAIYRSGGRQSDNIKSFLSLFRYACIRGLRVDLLFIYSENDRYKMNVGNHLKRLINEAGCGDFIGVDGGIFLLDRETLGEGEEYAIKRLCGCVADASAPLSVTVKANRFYVELSSDGEKALVKSPEKNGEIISIPNVQTTEKCLTGIFHSEGFLAEKSRVRAPYALVAASKSLGFVSTQNSLGFTFASNSALEKLTPHDADALAEDSGERLILRLYDAFGGGFEDYDVCACACFADYRMGKMIYYGQIKGFKFSLCVYADKKLAVKYLDMEVKCEDNETNYELIYAVKPCLGQTKQNARCYIYEPDSAHNAVKVYPVAADGIRRNAAVMFCGKGKIYTDIAALKSDGRYFCGTDDLAAVKVACDENKQQIFKFALAAFMGEKDYEYIRNSFSSGYRSCADGDIEPEVTIKSDDILFDEFTNKYVLYQCVASRMTARCGFYQVGGAYGFRDQLQDALSLDLKTLRRQILFCTCHQFREGDVMHWWHNISGGGSHKGIRTRCSDDCAWLLFAILEYIDRSGDDGFADIRLPFVDAPPLHEYERERYERVSFTKDKHSVYAHMLLCARALCRRGEHGLCLIGSHDWNDGMNAVGREGKGESVWLSQFASYLLKRFADFCSERGDNESSEEFGKISAEIKENVEKSGFEHDRYLRGYYDDGTKLGGVGSGECEIDVLPQAFSVFDGFDCARANISMKTLVTNLYDADVKLIKLLSPPFDSGKKYPGYIKGYVPGTRENGGQYTHAAIWAAMALMLYGDAEQGTKILKNISPALRSRDALLVEKYVIEPFVLAGDVYSCGELSGHGGWSWYTGAAGWFRTAVISTLCGYRRHGGGFYLSPLLNAAFTKVSLTVKRDNTAYEIKISKCGKDELFLDGEKLLQNHNEVLFMFDGKRHTIELNIK